MTTRDMLDDLVEQLERERRLREKAERFKADGRFQAAVALRAALGTAQLAGMTQAEWAVREADALLDALSKAEGESK